MEKLTLKALTQLLVNLGEQLNPYVVEHHRRSAVAAYYIGRELKLSAKDLRDVVIATSLHDIGVLSAEELDMVMSEDDSRSERHCTIGYELFSLFKPFTDIAQIVRYHHTHYFEGEHLDDFNKGSYIVHLAHRIDSHIAPNMFILTQSDRIVDRIEQSVGSVFDPDTYDAFVEVSNHKDFWTDMMELSLVDLFERIDFSENEEVDFETLKGFIETLKKLVDDRRNNA